MVVRGPLGDHEFKGQFSGHETFPVRYGWLKKVVDAVSNAPRRENQNVFNPDIAMAHFGVGKNMVASMKHWGLATGVIESKSTTRTEVTELGRLLLADDGYDPYLEKPASLWALHWRIAGSPERTTTWFWAFNHFAGAALDRDALAADVTRLCRERGWSRIAKTTIRRDIDCFFRTYVIGRAKHGGITEDSLECPLAELELIRPTAVRGVYEFRRGPKPGLPDGVFNFAFAEFWRRQASAETLTVEAVTYEPGSPGRAFKLDERAVAERLVRVAESSGGAFRWSDTAGLQQVIRTRRDIDPLDFLHSAYEARRSRAAA